MTGSRPGKKVFHGDTVPLFPSTAAQGPAARGKLPDGLLAASGLQLAAIRPVALSEKLQSQRARIVSNPAGSPVILKAPGILLTPVTSQMESLTVRRGDPERFRDYLAEHLPPSAQDPFDLSPGGADKFLVVKRPIGAIACYSLMIGAGTLPQLIGESKVVAEALAAVFRCNVNPPSEYLLPMVATYAVRGTYNLSMDASAQSIEPLAVRYVDGFSSFAAETKTLPVFDTQASQG